MKFTNEDVQQILQLLDATKYDDLLLETERFKLTLRRNRDGGNWTEETQVLSEPNIVKASTGTPVAVNAGAMATADSAKPEDSRKAGWLDVRAHLPGTFYRSPKPGAPPFVEIGSHVEEETVVGIIETMKLMNAIHAPTRGEIVEICFENAQFTERDAVLMRIKPGSE
jgi:acetyl-CoA carboxylase biotin carboxyl carrier protein